MTKKQELIQRLNATIAALSNVFVSGKQNMNNLLGSIGVLESCIELLQDPSSEDKRGE